MAIRHKQQGFALITVLMVVALVTIIASQLIHQQALTIQRSANMIHQAQASSVAWGLETWIKKGLRQDAQQNEIDHLTEQWAVPMMPIPFAGGQVSGQLFDLQAKINVNNLQETDQNKRKAWQVIIQRFLTQQQLEADLAEVIEDWVDADNNALFNGAESDYYLLKVPAYRAANQKLVLVQELGLLKGFTRQVVQQISPYITTLPAITKININTANATVLQALAIWMSADIANEWVTKRQEKPAQTIAEFRIFLVAQLPNFTNEDITKDLPDYIIDVKSNYFFLQGLIEYGQAKRSLLGIFMRDDNKEVKLIQRWVGISNE